MPLNADYILNRPFDAIETTVSDRDAMFYALSIGMGRDPLDAHDLPYVYEKDLRPFPLMPIILGHPGNWMVQDPAEPRSPAPWSSTGLSGSASSAPCLSAGPSSRPTASPMSGTRATRARSSN